MATICKRPIMIYGVITLSFFMTLIMFLNSLATLTYTEVGLNYSNWFKTIENKTYHNGI